MSQDLSPRTIEDLGDEIADTERFAGGGAAAAMSLVGAAATVELVLQLGLKRRKISDDDRRTLTDAVQLCQGLRNIFRLAIDEDIASLTELMDALSQLRQAKKMSDIPPEEITRRSQQAIDAAIETPLRVARDAKRLLRTVEELQHLARPFTASDLGAAAATTSGAITSLLLMAEVNVGMVEDEEDATRIAQEIEDLYSQTVEQTERVIAHTRSVIR